MTAEMPEIVPEIVQESATDAVPERPDDATLPELLAARARGASTRRLTLDVAVGAAAAVAVLVWHPRLWPLGACAALCFAAFGAWGLADRRVRDGERAAAMRGVRVAAAALGTLAAIGLAIGVVAVGVGRVIS